MTQTTAPTDLSLRSLTAPGLQAVRCYWRPFVLLQTMALLLVVGYYNAETVRAACAWLADLKATGGLLYSAIAVSIAGALLPEVAKVLVLGERRFDAARWSAIGFAVLAFAGSGIITDLQYRLFGLIIGTGTDAYTVARKVLVDQFITTPIYGVSYWAVVYGWRANGYNIRKTLREITPRWYALRVVPLLIPCWCFWIPMTALIYSLPATLQLSLFSLATAAWSLVMIFVATRPKEDTCSASEEPAPL